MRIPIFPLNTVLFPGGPLPLRIFESRYIDMVSACIRDDALFGVLLIRDGNETGAATTYSVGTLARIKDWYQGSDGLLGVTAVGEQRFRLLSGERQTNGLNMADVEPIAAEEPLPLPPGYEGLPRMLNDVLDELGKLYATIDRAKDDAVWLTYRFLEILPIDLERKQQSLENSDTLQRLQLVNEMLNSVRTPANH